MVFCCFWFCFDLWKSIWLDLLDGACRVWTLWVPGTCSTNFINYNICLVFYVIKLCWVVFYCFLFYFDLWKILWLKFFDDICSVRILYVWGTCDKNFITYGAHLIFDIIKLYYVQWYSIVFYSVFIYGKFSVQYFVWLNYLWETLNHKL